MKDTKNCMDKKTPKEYARELLMDSLVNGLPNILKTPNVCRKCFKASVLLLCICGFLYQTTEFIKFILTFPSIVDIVVSTPEKSITPSITFCNNNGIMRSKFCAKYPERCETPENQTEFCDAYPHYCPYAEDWQNFKVPKQEYFDFEKEASIDELKELGHEFGTLAKSLSIQAHYSRTYDERKDVEGPLIFVKKNGSPFICYVLMSRAESHREPSYDEKDPTNLAVVPSVEMELDFEESETFVPGREPGGLLSIHSPFDYVNPHQFGDSLRPGLIYKVHYDLEEEKLLPSPYHTNCKNYTQSWEENGRQGPRSQAMCKEFCYKTLFGLFNCSVVYPLSYPAKESKWCNLSELFGDQIFKGELSKVETCAGDCKDDCEKYKFFYVVQERFVESGKEANAKNKKTRPTSLEFFVLDPEVVSYRHRPQYQNIEIFSYIGGYVGAWLGISLVAVMDFLESMGLLALFTFRERRHTKEKGTTPTKEDIALDESPVLLKEP